MQKVKTVDISGMGGEYENARQKMLQAGLEFMEKNPGIKPADMPNYKYEGTEPAQALERAIITGSGGDCTGAQFGAVVGHLFAIQRLGREEWIRQACEDQPEREFEWDGTEASCPKTELSERMKKEQGEGPRVN